MMRKALYQDPKTGEIMPLKRKLAALRKRMRDLSQKPIVALDSNAEPDAEGHIHIRGTAFYRIDQAMLEFLRGCQEKHGILGFEWDGSYNFGVIVSNPHPDPSPEEPPQP